MNPLPVSDAICHGADLDCGTGLLMLIRASLDQLESGQILEVTSTEPTVEHDLPAWCRVSANPLVATHPSESLTHYYLRKGTATGRVRPDWGMRAALRQGTEFDTADWYLGKAGEVPAVASSASGFAPRGSIPEPGAPEFAFTLNERDRVWADNVAELYEQATASQWDASRDIPWNRLEPLPDALERAVCQLMTFLTENEFAALYVPGNFVSRIHPAFQEVVMFLTTQMADESRHIEAFTKRALANGGGLQYSAATTQISLKSLYDQSNFTRASFLLSVLGEGTFLDLLRFIEEHAPDPATAEIMRRARLDETRHVHFGMAHVKHTLAADPGRAQELVIAVKSRAAVLEGVTGISPLVKQALTVLSGGGLAPEQITLGMARVEGLMALMDTNRRKRLLTTGFSEAQAQELSQLHTPNFM